jgi:RND family efflux transporter MFP subunit
MSSPETNPHSTPAPGHAQHGNPDAIPNDLPKVGGKTVTLFSVGVLVIFGAMFVLGYIPNRQRIREAKEVAKQQDDRPIVDVQQPKKSDATSDLLLPGDARALQETAIFPRANGYIKRLHVDIGDRVKAGQLLAELEAPEIDAQLNESRAAEQQAAANVTKSQTDFELNKITYERYQSLAQTGAVMSQDVDQKRSMYDQARAALDAAKANVAAAHAAVQNLTETKGFQKVTAPFPGVISARNYDVGALLNPSAGNKELFRLAQVDTIRVFANLPQSYVAAIHNGQEASFESRNYPGKSFKGKLVRSAGAIDPATRTMRIEVHFPNPENQLFAGMYGTLRLPVAGTQPALMVPTSAMIFKADGTKLAVVEDGKIRTQPVVVGRDFGTEMEILDGLKGDEQVVTSPGQRIADGVEVEVAQKSPAQQGSPQKGPQTAQR